MKIVAGLGSLDEYVRFCDAGADEFFAGYVPYDWNRKYGTMLPLNRREVLCCNVQLGSFSELEILAAMVRKYQKPVHLTFNALYYIPEQYPEIATIIRQSMGLGFRSYILADPALICYLRQEHIDCEIHLSGESAEVNSRMFFVFQRQQIQRLIFHRKNSFDDMRRVVQAGHGEEFEAFVLNELCHFTVPSAIPCTATRWAICAGCRTGLNRKNAGSGQKTEAHRSSFPGLKTVTSAVPPVAAYVPCISFGRRESHT